MDRVEIVVCRSNGEAVFSGFTENGFKASKWIKWSKEAGSQSTFRMPLNCPKNGERVIYLLCGLAATFAQLAFSPGSNVPNLGASGAIAGVLGAYILLFPKGKVRVLQGQQVIQVPALIVIGIWIVLQFFSGIGSIANVAQTGGVAYMAHIGGFLAGFALTFLFRGSRGAQAAG